MDGWMDGRTDRRTDGWVGGWMDGWKDVVRYRSGVVDVGLFAEEEINQGMHRLRSAMQGRAQRCHLVEE